MKSGKCCNETSGENGGVGQLMITTRFRGFVWCAVARQRTWVNGGEQREKKSGRLRSYREKLGQPICYFLCLQ